MKNTLTVLLFSLLFTLPSLTVAQMGTEEKDANKYLTNRKITINANERDFSGSSYENEEFVNGYVFKDGKILATNVALRYNANRDEIEVKKSVDSGNESARVLIKSNDIYIKILNKVFVYSPVMPGIDKAGYFMAMHEGENYSLFKKITKEYIEGRESVNSITRDTPPAYKEVETFYLVDKSDGSFSEFPKSRKGKLKLFPDHKKKLKEFVKENRLNINRDYNLTKLVRYYDTL